MRAESLLVKHHSRHAQPEQAGGSAATAAASARLTRRRGALRQVLWLSGTAGRGASTAGVRMAGSLNRCGAASRSSDRGSMGPGTGIDGMHLDRPLPRQPRQLIADTVSAATASSKKEAAAMSSSNRKRRARMRSPAPTAATMRARKMIDAITGIAPGAAPPQFVTAVLRRAGSSVLSRKRR